ncbi:uncharacterized protein AC631_04104 [Debaryomyces fabryi]|uniref:20S-pre-rRNA D-site endonuclease NOB1 n=1 Tax=Debaryomyces fabryi TaxID=58627 RepID=A0A0V1PV78_9ASCO|nr:uncharacterized protein AC631_04104 [Debaryomyces fabryi]KSA00145.1 hypothetical protein AC631_04104 [Debaryomyces fabryi]CUM47826.1 unnamed protein product [Debaryomyces fabryi]
MSELNGVVDGNKKIKTLVFDAGPLITQTASSLQQYAYNYYTTPGVHSELKDDNVRQQLLIWDDKLQVRQPKPQYIQKVVSFAKLTGDYAVLSTNDLHIIALAYELECEANNGDWRLRKYPGEVLEHQKKVDLKHGTKPEVELKDQSEKISSTEKIDSKSVPEQEESTQTAEVGKKKPRRRGGKKQRAKREAQLQKELDEVHVEDDDEVAPTVSTDQTQDCSNDSVIPDVTVSEESPKAEPTEYASEKQELDEAYDEEDDDGDWITPENLQEEMVKDNNEQIQEASSSEKLGPFIKVALSTGDFACQNVAMQIGLNLMNAMSGKQIRRVRNYMYRCYACFRLTPIPKSGKPKHFCPKCGGNTLLRCAVSIDTTTGKVTPHLKANFQWFKRGDRYTLPSPLSKNQQRLQGKAGYQHNKQNRHKTLQEPLILREDQKEYDQAVKNDEWQRRQNDKMLQQWIGGGSADNYVSPFTTLQNIRPSGVKVGKGRFVNSSKGKRS